ncbi:hypothetical protein ES705_35853 [subsurface metagenome]
MSRIHYREATSQIIIFVLDFTTYTRHVFIVVKNHPVEAVGSRTAFNPLTDFPFLENTSNPDRDVSDLMLDCVCSGKGVGSMEITEGLLKALPGVDPSTIRFGICGKEKGPGEPPLYGDIGCIVIVGEVGDDKEIFLRGDKIFISEKAESVGGSSSEGYHPSRVERFERKADKKAETKKPDLHIVPKRGDRKKKAAKYPTVPKEIMDWCKAHYTRGEWKRILRGLHKFCRYKKRREDKYYPGTSERKNRQYVYGQQWLADKLGLNRWTVEIWFHRFEADGIIYIPYRGYKKRGASICELAFKDKHRKKNKRETGERKNRLSIR